MKKIRPSHKYTYLTFLIVFVFLTLLLWSIVGSRSWIDYGDYIKNRLWVELTYIGSSLFVCLLGVIIYYINVYYIVDENKIIRKGRGMDEIPFKNIVYLDEEYSSTHHEIKIYVNTGKWYSLVKDKKGIIYSLIKEKSTLLTKDQLQAKYPESIRHK